MTADPRARRVLREYRNATAQPPASRDALWDRIERSIDEGAELEPPSSMEAGTPERPRRAAVLLAVVLGSSAVVGVGLAPRLWPSPEPPPPAVATAPTPEPDAPVPPRPKASTPPPTSPEIPVDAALEPPPLQRPARAPVRARAVEAEAPASGEALREEMLLIARARASMRQRQPSAALGVLEDHLRRFPRGQMREDRAVLRIEALCAIGKRRQANIEVEAFTRTFPGSAHLGRVRALCPGEQSVPGEQEE